MSSWSVEKLEAEMESMLGRHSVAGSRGARGSRVVVVCSRWYVIDSVYILPPNYSKTLSKHIHSPNTYTSLTQNTHN